MIKLIILSAMLNTGEITAILPEVVKTEARSRKGKGQRGRKRGGGGLRQLKQGLCLGCGNLVMIHNCHFACQHCGYAEN